MTQLHCGMGGLEVRSRSAESRRDGGRSAQDAIAMPVIMIGYAVVRALISPEAQSDATAPVEDHAGVGPFFESGEPRNKQRDSAEQFSRSPG
jgi:hypothetical protein